MSAPIFLFPQHEPEIAAMREHKDCLRKVTYEKVAELLRTHHSDFWNSISSEEFVAVATEYAAQSLEETAAEMRKLLTTHNKDKVLQKFALQR